LGSGKRKENDADFGCVEVGSRPRVKSKTFGFLNDFAFDSPKYQWICPELPLTAMN
jgi:hypothetical protein